MALWPGALVRCSRPLENHCTNYTNCTNWATLGPISAISVIRAVIP
jgi:hypothetical protein